MIAWALFILFFVIWLLGGGFAVNEFGAESFIAKALIYGVAALVASLVTTVLAKLFRVIE